MKIVSGISIVPSFNLAMEEYFLKEKDENFFMLWQNDKSIIVGRNQNTLAEINYEYIKENEIAVIRRMTGGGAVFHDLGNINYTFISRNSLNAFNDYAFFSEPIIECLKSLGVEAELSGRNDMLIDGKKFSGNAQCAYKNSVMHHGTLMFSSELSDLSQALHVNPLKIQSKGISSVRSRVTNISEHLDRNFTAKYFMRYLLDNVRSHIDGAQMYDWTEYDKKRIAELEKEKYATWEWNYGYKKEYSFKKEKLFSFGIVEVNLTVENNIIEEAGIFGDFFGIRDISELEKSLIGIRHKESDISEVINSIDIQKYIAGMTSEEMLGMFI